MSKLLRSAALAVALLSLLLNPNLVQRRRLTGETAPHSGQITSRAVRYMLLPSEFRTTYSPSLGHRNYHRVQILPRWRRVRSLVNDSKQSTQKLHGERV